MSYRTVELSSLATALRDLTERVSAHADAADAGDDEEVGHRTVRRGAGAHQASRRLGRLTVRSDADRPVTRTVRQARTGG